jgi:hypothetical protein
MKRQVALLALWCAVSLLGDGQVNAKLKNGNRQMKSILILPAQATVTMFGFKGSQGIWPENDKFEDDLTALVGKTLTHHRAQISATPLAEVSAADRQELAEIQRQFDSVEAQILRSRGGVKKGRYTLGDSIAAYAPASSADTLVFIRAKGRLPVNLKVGSLLMPELDGQLTFVDARTGEILAFLEFSCDSHNWMKSVDQLASHIQESLILVWTSL